jgi:hypothetical protein
MGEAEMVDSTILDKGVFKDGMKDLEGAFLFSTTINEQTIKTYWKYLSNNQSDKFTNAVREIILREDRFPSISKLISAINSGTQYPRLA